MLKEFIIKRANLLTEITLAIMVFLYTYFTVITFAPVNGYIGDEVWYPTAAYNILKLVFHVTPPMYFPYSQEANIQTYINPEHPPLAKYIMDLFILLMGYKPIAWRIGSWIMGDLMVIVGFLLARKLVGGELGNVAGLVSALLIMLSPNLWLLHGIAMLDIYVGSFILLSLYFLLSDNLLLASITLGLAMASKESAFPLILPFLYYVGEFKKSPIQRAVYGIGIPASVYAILSVPIMVYFGGISGWIHNSFLFMLGWDATNGHIALTAIDQISTPWDWFLDIHPFYVGYNFYASTNPFIMWAWVVTTPLAFIVRDLKSIILTMSAWTMWLAFCVVYILGNHTLFSFYVTDFAGIIDVYVTVSIFKFYKWISTRRTEKVNNIVSKEDLGSSQNVG
ncbi:glycosyltransferase family 39 protein [Stygiolobus caldivivus]|uniref:Glycosyl transferase n=1 Tax=Stygiolobus caldivivus TaxID=2824673 RepID=A0A8D5U5I7_9CREN|nr:glycosyltransferase family 39 protein [Stygiolobus caldivivus]BCU69382.1 glycosyl transferase [Stygiolobus caldivivus]